MTRRESLEQLPPHRLGTIWVVQLHPDAVHGITETKQLLRILD